MIKTEAKEGCICMDILDRCLDSEDFYPTTFWVQCFNCFVYNEMGYETTVPLLTLFHSFLNFTIHFNDEYPGLLPDIFHNNFEFKKAIHFVSGKLDDYYVFFMRVNMCSIVHVVDNQEEEKESGPESDEEEVYPLSHVNSLAFLNL